MTSDQMARRLAAILAVDIVGYSRLMEGDEGDTLARLKEHFTERFEATVARHGGRLVNLVGDGALAEFASAVDALGAAIEFQQANSEANADEFKYNPIAFRIGLHLGDLTVDGSNLYGDAVNIAERLGTQAPPDGILISRNVHDAVEGKLKATFEDFGDLALKTMDQPVQAFSVKWEPEDWKVSALATAVPPLSRSLTRFVIQTVVNGLLFSLVSLVTLGVGFLGTHLFSDQSPVVAVTILKWMEYALFAGNIALFGTALVTSVIQLIRSLLVRREQHQ